MELEAPEPLPDVVGDLLDVLNEPLALVSEDGVVLVANAAFATAVGWDLAELIGRDLLDLCIDDEATIAELLRRFAGTSSTRPGTLRVRDARGETVVHHVLGARLRSTGALLVRVRNPSAAVAPFAMLSQQVETRNLRELAQQLEASLEQLRVSNALLETTNRELDAYASVVSHDLRNPLETIAGFTELLREDVGDDPDVASMLDAVDRSIVSMRTTIDALLRLARIGSANVPEEPTEVDPVAREVVDELDAEVRSAAARVTIERVPAVAVDEAHLHQLLLNLITNALRYRAPDRPAVVSITGEREDGTVRLVVADNGLGVPESERERIFDLMTRGAHTRHVPGSGIGLATCRKVAELYGGSIVCEPNGEHGTRFVVSLPAGEPRGR